MAMNRHLLNSSPARQIESRAVEIARNSNTAVLQRLTRQVMTMGEHEARGYIRGRARETVERQASLDLAHRKKLSPRYRTEVISRAIGCTVDLVMRDLNHRVAELAETRKAG